jgi:hypothetical protein
LLAACLIAAASRYVAAPINAMAGLEQFHADLDQKKADCILTTSELTNKLDMPETWADENDISEVVNYLVYAFFQDGV